MSEKQLTGRKILMVIAPDQFRDEELLTPKNIFVLKGAQVQVASTTTNRAKGMLGAQVMPDLTIDQAKAADYDAVVVVGGMGSPEYLWNNVTLHNILKQMQKDNKVTAGICLSGAVLAKAGLLKGKKATVWVTPKSLAALAEGQAQYVKQKVVQDGLVITAEGPEAADEFGQLIVNQLSKITSRA